MIQRNSFEMATHDFAMKWPTSIEREAYITFMELRETGRELCRVVEELQNLLNDNKDV